MLLVLDNLKGHKTPAFVHWLMEHGVMPLYTPIAGSWLNMAESIQRIIVRRALAGQSGADHRVVGGHRPWLESPPDPVRVGWQTESKARSCAFQTPCIGWLWSVFEAGNPLNPYAYGK